MLQRDDPLLERIPTWAREETLVRICEGLPASFIRVGKEKVDGVIYRKAVYLQKELRPEQMELVMRHEGQHLELSHCGWKTYANIGLVLYWWNPLVWLGYRYFCRDLELACDRAVLNELDERERREYARTLVELGSGRQLWEAPLSFGECDAELRVKAAVAWKPPAPKWGWKNLAAVAVTVVLALFFLAGPENLTREEDRALAWQRQVESGPVAEFPPSSVYRQEGAQTLYLTELWIKAEDADNPAYYYGKDEAGTWWTLRVIWHNSREEYQAYQHEASGFPERLEQEAFLQIK